MKPLKKAIFPVGGLGTRFLPATKAMPKEMLPIVDKPLIQYAFEEAKAAGIEQFIFITGRNKNVIANHFDHSYELQRVLDESDKQQQLSLTRDWLPEPGSIAFIRQQQPLGLGHAVWCARHFIKDEPFAVLLADELLLSPKSFLKDMCELYEKKGGNIVAVGEIGNEKSQSYGIIDPASREGDIVKVKTMVEKPKPADAPSNLSITGRYILQPEIFELLDKKITGVGGEIQLTDALAEMTKTQDFHALIFRGQRFDCGNHKGFIEANIAYALAHPELQKDVRSILKAYLA